MASSRTKGLAVAATLFGGLLAGVSANRSLVQIPAWKRIGAAPWAAFTRAENHGLGALFYPAIGLAALLFTAATAIAFRFDRAARGSRSFPIYSAAVVAVAWAVATRGFVVPALFSLGEVGNNAVELQGLLLSLARWWAINDVLHALSFGLNLWALTEVLSSSKGT